MGHMMLLPLGADSTKHETLAQLPRHRRDPDRLVCTVFARNCGGGGALAAYFCEVIRTPGLHGLCGWPRFRKPLGHLLSSKQTPACQVIPL